MGFIEKWEPAPVKNAEAASPRPWSKHKPKDLEAARAILAANPCALCGAMDGTVKQPGHLCDGCSSRCEPVWLSSSARAWHNNTRPFRDVLEARYTMRQVIQMHCAAPPRGVLEFGWKKGVRWDEWEREHAAFAEGRPSSPQYAITIFKWCLYGRDFLCDLAKIRRMFEA